MTIDKLSDQVQDRIVEVSAWVVTALIIAIVLFAGAQEPVSARDDFNDFFIPLHAAPSK